MMASSDDVPGLDDMTELVKGIKLKQKQTQPKTVENEKKKSKESHKKPVVTVPKAVKPKEKTNMFGGMKRGFLSGNSQSRTNEKPCDIISPKSTSKQHPLVFDDVQKAIQECRELDQSWLTQDLIDQVQANTRLREQITQPHIARALAYMQKDPGAAMEFYKDDKEIETFLSEFYGLISKHFRQLGAEQSPSSYSNLEQDDEAIDIISDPEIRAILLKPDIQKLIELLRSDTNEAEDHLNSRNATFKADVQKLISVGILSYHQF